MKKPLLWTVPLLLLLIASGIRCSCEDDYRRELVQIADALKKLSESKTVTVDDIDCKESVNRSDVICKEIDGFRWIVVQMRTDSRQNFNRSWEEYRKGFGDERNYWIGNELLHDLTKNESNNSNNSVLRVELEDWRGNKAWAEYADFSVDSEPNKYRLNVGKFRGNASDGLSSHNGSLFSTYDVKNDEAPECCPCASAYGGGWWFNSCFEANLNGMYRDVSEDAGYYGGIIWEPWLGNYSLKRSEMMVRRLPYRRGTDVPEDP
ncbi:PREDICTED: angiopoietin-related protein 7-like [Nicrophorus vespilloides]|uniref:Angiopoietin-related protein 7-like n=1 Tax=Nicrophorus vespilloides TaxID=110193 RepID=A0ABM1M1P9_NICVS|nr:PREDICTED: angiopoietin-related protein 7-like [Nicrophorus vespilloides]